MLTDITRYNLKLIISGLNIDLYECVSFIPLNYNSNKRKKNSLRDYTPYNLFKARKKLINYCYANPNLNKFLTLTYSSFINKLSQSNNLFNNFNVKIRNLFPNYKYIAVPEYQKSGRLHYHLLNNLPYIPKEKIAKLWGNGYIDVRRLDNKKNIPIYVGKYISKEIIVREKGKKKFFTSQNIVKPKTLYNEDAQEFMQSENLKTKYSKIYKSYFGDIKYINYELIKTFG